MLICLFLMILEYQFKIPKQKITYADVNFDYEHKEEATQVLNRGAQTASRGSCLSQVLNRGAQAAARGAVPFVSQVFGRGAQVVGRGAQADA